jgi:hypothetical protein
VTYSCDNINEHWYYIKGCELAEGMLATQDGMSSSELHVDSSIDNCVGKLIFSLLILCSREILSMAFTTKVEITVFANNSKIWRLTTIKGHVIDAYLSYNIVVINKVMDIASLIKEIPVKNASVIDSTPYINKSSLRSGGSDIQHVKGPIHDQSCCAKLFCATQVCAFTIKSISTIHDQSCCTTRNVAQHD